MEGTCPSGGSPPRFLAKVNARIPRLCARFVHLRVGRKRVVYIMTYESWAMVKGPPYNCTEYRTVIACRLLKDVSYLFFPFLLVTTYYSLRTPTPYPRTCFLPLALLGSMRLPHDFHRKTWLRPCQKVTETWQFLRLASELGFWYRGRSRHNAISTLVIQRTS